MIVVKIELHSARTGYVTEIGRMHIANISCKGNDSKRGDYRVKLFRRRAKGGTLDVLREGEVRDYPRLSYPVWHLVLRAIKTVIKGEEK